MKRIALLTALVLTLLVAVLSFLYVRITPLGIAFLISQARAQSYNVKCPTFAGPVTSLQFQDRGGSFVDHGCYDAATGNLLIAHTWHIAAPGSGHDLRYQVEPAIAAFSQTNPGMIELGSGTSYPLTATINKPFWVGIEGHNAVITVASLSGPAILTSSPGPFASQNVATYDGRGINNLTLIGSGASATPYGIWIGADPAGVITAAGARDFMPTFSNVHVKHFGAAYVLGGHSTHPKWIGGVIDNQYNEVEDGIRCVPGMAGIENATIIGTTFLGGGGNRGQAINCPDAAGTDMRLTDVSIDFYNSCPASGCRGMCSGELDPGPQITFNNGVFVFEGHLETCSNYMIASTEPNKRPFVVIKSGTQITYDETSSVVTPGVVEMGGAYPILTVEAGVSIGLAGNAQTLGAFAVSKNSTGQVSIGPYYATRGGLPYTVPGARGTWNSVSTPEFSSGIWSGQRFGLTWDVNQIDMDNGAGSVVFRPFNGPPSGICSSPTMAFNGAATSDSTMVYFCPGGNSSRWTALPVP
jgi:hypothetical protein